MHPKNKARLNEDWPGLFRDVFLQMMPVDDLGEGFSSDFGRLSLLKSCENSPKLKQCIAFKHANNYIIKYDSRGLRLRIRRIYEMTEEFSERYRFRKWNRRFVWECKTAPPLRRLGVRGKEAVYNAIYSIMTMHNIMQMVQALRNQQNAALKTLQSRIDAAFACICATQRRLFAIVAILRAV